MHDSGDLLVMKFGGTSVGTVDAMRQAVAILLEAQTEWARVVAVTSALSGVTNLLIDSAVHAAQGDASRYHAARGEILDRHLALIDALLPDPVARADLHAQITALTQDFANLCQAMFVLGEASPRALDAVASLGERMSVRILSAAAAAQGVPAVTIESTRLVITDDHFQNALPDMPATVRLTNQTLWPLLEQGSLPIVTGFIGATTEGQTTTLGRGGSDYSASILAVALGAKDVWIWTDVDGVMTADPRMVREARTIPVLSYREVAEMAHFGARVLHPKSIHPVIEAGIGLRVCNTFNPHGPDTRLVDNGSAAYNGSIRAVAAIRGMQLVTVSGRGMLGVPGVAGRIFSAVATTGISVPLIIESTSEQAICFPAPKESTAAVLRTLHAHLAREFERGDIDRAAAGDEVDIITVICPGMRVTPGVSGRIFGTLGDASVNVLGISFGASDVSLNLIVAATQTQTAVRAIHALID